MTEQNWEDRVDAAVRTVRAGRPPMTDAARATAKARLTATMRGEPDTVVALARGRERGRNRWLPLAAAAAAVVVVGTGVVALSSGDDVVRPAAPKVYPELPPQPIGPDAQGKFPPIPPVGDVPLNSAERFVGQGSDLPQGPDQYLLVTTRTWTYHRPDTPESLEMGIGKEELRQDWIPTDRNHAWQRTIDRDVHRPAPAPNMHNAPPPDQISGPTSSEGTFVKPGGEFNRMPFWYDDPVHFPADGRRMYERFREEANTEGSTPVDALTQKIVKTLSDGDLTRDQRSLVYQALSYYPYLRIVENVRTRDGREAVSIGFTDANSAVRDEVLIDPATTQVIGTRVVALKDNPIEPTAGGVLQTKAGEVATESVLTYQVVNRRGATQ
ncbi:CU044_5270 family protein [Amycolatopsis sp. YIM 10]|uniref:CU044_5270 family protein n=1 Tax=Amycolatopsis sp. YIM 10 TaxID=2653857 RepID=UPI0012904F90|nr:CU044_5270 family protein [Amycolatopsis sp. YIM 10]QFU91131.1 hypothetical protein YIM_29825 [Amycolatopsis sp. YIM 10]